MADKRRGNKTAQKNREARQEHLRDYLAEHARVNHIVKNIIRIEDLDTESETFANDLAKLRTANEQRLKLLNKYLPDLKSQEITGENGEQLKIEIVRFANPE